VLLTVDIARLIEAKEAGLTQPVATRALADNIPQKLRDREDHWFALTMRARVVYASKERVKQNSITYEELAEPKWKGKICSRSGQHAYNTALIASIIAHKGEVAAETWLRGIKENLPTNRREETASRSGTYMLANAISLSATPITWR
jgi:iron(III) transport system substrate-binding protein